MAITALPEATVQLMGSSQVLTTPTSLVKELVDNALDAKATNIDIIISQNTLDKIEVRDNGRGISPEDLDALGRRGHTSKLRSFEELRFLGGSSLGFRGESLASAVQLGDVSVITRTDGEAVATTARLKPSGGIDQQRHCSHPVGTTISITNFLSKLPVRKQTTLKDVAKTHAKIKELIQAYALARCHIKFSLKVAKSGKGNWSFMPRPNDGIREIFSMVFGRDAALQCLEKSVSTSEGEDTVVSGVEAGKMSNSSKRSGFVIEAFLPKPDADPTKLGNGKFLSIDGRPVSHEKGTMKKIMTMFKKYLRSTLEEKLSVFSLRLNIRCPVACYDPNVEPAKDDVIFENEHIVLELVENIFKDVYGEPKPMSPAKLQSLGKKLDDFEILLARNPSVPAATNESTNSTQQEAFTVHQVSDSIPVQKSLVQENPHLETLKSSEEATITRGRKWSFDMSRDYTEVVENHGRNKRPSAINTIQRESPNSSDPSSSLNPWIIAKINASNQDKRYQEDVSPFREDFAPRFRPAAQTRGLSRYEDFSDPENSLNRHQDAAMKSGPPISNLDDPILVHPAFEPQPIRNMRPSLYDAVEDESLLPGNTGPPSRAPVNNFTLARSMIESALLSPPASSGPKAAHQRRRGPTRPFVSPLTSATERTAIQDSLVQTRLAIPKLPPQAHNTVEKSTDPEANLELAWAMEFEARKEEATRRRRSELQASNDDHPFPLIPLTNAQTHFSSSPHKNRYKAALTALSAQPPTQTPRQAQPLFKAAFKTSLPDGDPRGYLMRRQNSLLQRSDGSTGVDGPRIKRMKSSRLPLESILAEVQNHRLVQTIAVNRKVIRSVGERLSGIDGYVKRGILDVGLEVKDNEVGELEERLRRVVRKWADSMSGREVHPEFEKVMELEFDLSNMFRRKKMNVA
ncbi:hypothetical protein B7494_g5904 [Chlorociboria aeruginascens]|nr:hypothetical protein B7494_g5904 [Chlorociboria aeruginascens]